MLFSTTRLFHVSFIVKLAVEIAERFVRTPVPASCDAPPTALPLPLCTALCTEPWNMKVPQRGLELRQGLRLRLAHLLLLRLRWIWFVSPHPLRFQMTSDIHPLKGTMLQHAQLPSKLKTSEAYNIWSLSAIQPVAEGVAIGKVGTERLYR